MDVATDTSMTVIPASATEPEMAACYAMRLENAMHITASVFINDKKSGRNANLLSVR